MNMNGESFSSFILGEFRIGVSTDPLFQTHDLKLVAGKYLTLLNSIIPAGSYILPGSDINSRIPLIPKTSYLVQSVKNLQIRIHDLAQLSNASVAISDINSTPIQFAWSDSPIFTNAPLLTSSIESFQAGQNAFSQVDNISARITGLDLDAAFLNIFPLIGVPAFHFMAYPQGSGDDVLIGVQAFSNVNATGVTINPIDAQMLLARQAVATQANHIGHMILRSELTHNLVIKALGGGTNSDQINFNITPTNQLPPSRAANIVFSENVASGGTDVKRIEMPINFFLESIIISSDQTTGAAASTVVEQWLLAGGGTVDNVIATLAAAGTSVITQVSRIIAQTLELTLVANAGSATEFLIQMQGQVVT